MEKEPRAIGTHHPPETCGPRWRIFDALLLGLGVAVFAWGWWRVAQSEFAWPWWCVVAIVGLVFAARRTWEPLALLACGLCLYAQWMGYELFRAEGDQPDGYGPIFSSPPSLLLALPTGFLTAAAVAFLGLLRSWVGGRRRRGVALGWFVGMGALLWGHLMLHWSVVWGALRLDPATTWLSSVGWVRLALIAAGMTCLWGCVLAVLARAGWRRLAIAVGTIGLTATLWFAGSKREGVITPREHWQHWYLPSSTTALESQLDAWVPDFWAPGAWAPLVLVLGKDRYGFYRRLLDEQDLRELTTKIEQRLAPGDSLLLAPWGRDLTIRDLAAAVRIVRQGGLDHIALGVKPPSEPRTWTMRVLDVAVCDGAPWTLPLPEIGEGGEVVIDGAASWQDLVDLLDEHREQGLEIERLSIVE